MAGGGAQKEPNLVLRRIREQERHESREQFAEAMARVARETGEDVYPDDKYVAKLESGDIRYPRPVYRRILAEVCGRPFSALGFSPPPGLRLSDDRDGNTSDAPAKHLNRALRDAIMDSGQELPQIARKVGTHPKTVERWITRGTVPHPQHRWKICKILGRDEAELWPNVVPAQGNRDFPIVSYPLSFDHEIHLHSHRLSQDDMKPILRNMSRATAVPVLSALREIHRGYVIGDQMMGGLSVQGVSEMTSRSHRVTVRRSPERQITPRPAP